jgi:lipoprotein-releasing system permease protein
MAVAFNSFERMVAFRYLRARRQEGFISLITVLSFLGIMLGVAALIIVMSVMKGERAELLHEILGLNGHIGIVAGPSGLSNYQAVADEVKRQPGVVAVYPIVEGQVLASANGQSTGTLVRGVEANDIAAEPVIARHLASDVLRQFGDDHIIVSDRLALRLGLRSGDPITFISPDTQMGTLSNLPRVATYHVVGTFEVGNYQYNSNVALAPLAAAQIFFRLPDAVTSLQVFVDDPNRAAALGGEIKERLGDSVTLTDWQQSNSAILGAVQVERYAMFIILSLIILVAAFNIISSMIMLVRDKTRDIGILRTMGATQGMVLRLFILSGATIGVVGTVLGFALGVAITTHIEDLRQLLQECGLDTTAIDLFTNTRIPAKIDPYEVGSVLAMSFGLSFLATLYPSWRAARLDPVEALRYE